jgi:hypothetical protein
MTTAQLARQIQNLTREVRVLKRDVRVALPTESLDGYAHKKEILSALAEARKAYPRT